MEIRGHFVMSKRKRIRKEIIPRNLKTLWKAVNLAKDINNGLIKNDDFIDMNLQQTSTQGTKLAYNSSLRV